MAIVFIIFFFSGQLGILLKLKKFPFKIKTRENIAKKQHKTVLNPTKTPLLFPKIWAIFNTKSSFKQEITLKHTPEQIKILYIYNIDKKLITAHGQTNLHSQLRDIASALFSKRFF